MIHCCRRLNVLCQHRDKGKTWVLSILFLFWSPNKVKTDLEVRALTQNIMADIQMVVRQRLGFFTLDLSFYGCHTWLMGVGEQLKVVGCNRPEMKV